MVLKMVPAKENIKRKEGGVKGKTVERKNIWSKDKEEHVLETENCLGRLQAHCTEFLKNSQWCKVFDKDHDCSASHEHLVFVKA